MKLSLPVWLTILGLGWLLPSPQVRAEPVASAVRTVTEEWEEALARRIERTLPALLSSLAAARREQDKGLVRCFDRAVAGLNSTQRQVSYHADLRDEASSESERARHARALVLLSARVDELALSVETCFTDGVLVKHGQTVVEVVVEKK